jgi:hypothetical protein
MWNSLAGLNNYWSRHFDELSAGKLGQRGLCSLSLSKGEIRQDEFGIPELA